MSVMLDITRLVKPPRTAFLDFPPGHTTGPPFNPALQRGIVRDALALLESVQVSGTIQPLAYTWPEGEDWKRSPLPPRLPREETPQYQCPEDRDAASGHEDESCPMCIVG